MSRSDKDKADFGIGAWLTGLFIGLAGGAAVAFLTAPKSGRELRHVLKRTADDIPHQAGSLVDDSLDLYASALNYCQLIIEEQTMRVRRAIAAGKLAAAKKREEIELEGSSVLPFQHQ